MGGEAIEIARSLGLRSLSTLKSIFRPGSEILPSRVPEAERHASLLKAMAQSFVFVPVVCRGTLQDMEKMTEDVGREWPSNPHLHWYFGHFLG